MSLGAMSHLVHTRVSRKTGPLSTASFHRQPVISATEFSKYNFQLTW